MEASKSELLSTVCDLARDKPPALAEGVDLDTLLQLFYRHVAPEDLLEREPQDLFGAVVAQLRLAQDRPQGTAAVKVFTPSASVNGWSAGGHTVVEVVTDDMPFLVDSVSMVLTQEQHDLHLVVHPQLVVRRDLAGRLHGVLDEHSRTEEHDVARESWMHLEIDRVPDEELPAITERLQKVLLDVRDAVEDWTRMHAQVGAVVTELEEHPPPLPAEEIEQGASLLRWLAEDHFTFLGYREYALEEHAGGDTLVAVPGTGFGILRADPGAPRPLPEQVAAHARDPQLLVLAKANSRATVHRPVFLDYVGVKKFDADGQVCGERRFLGLFSSAAYTESVRRIPVLREKAAAVIEALALDPMSHAGKALMDVLETYPRDELFQTSVEELVPIASQVVHTRERRQLKLFVRRDRYGRFLSCLVYLPRDRYNTSVRERIAAILRRQLGGDSVEYTAHVGESFSARLHFVVRPAPGELVAEPDVPDLERRCAEAARSWRDDFTSAVVSAYGEEQGSRHVRTYASSFPEAYKEDYPPASGAVDLGRLEAITGEEGIALSLYEDVTAAPGEARLKVYRIGPPLSLSHVLPVLSTMGVEVVDERPYELVGLPRASHIYDFGLRYPRPLPDDSRERFQDTVLAVWDGLNESDGFNALVLAAGLTWRQAMLLRAYAKHLRQGGTPFAQDYIEGALLGNVELTRTLVQLFEARFDPGTRHHIAADSEARQAQCAELEERVLRGLDEVTSLDQDRILRSYLTMVKATLRTSYFVTGTDGRPLDRLSLKLDPSQVPDLPQPRPRFEIFVYSPRVEGVHLRFGSVARGGLRWSDRRDDFRTEILGLVKAQMVKNTVIVPVGAKGGFFAKQLPDPSDRDAWLAEGVAAYTTFISGLLDVTDNLVETPAGRQVVPPERVVRHDHDDTYLVVAADKGTATFSDIANGVSQQYGFWLGDAFASGGSVGYDHKAMGITARGAWVSVRRHFREMGVDCQAEDVTAVGVGDMSGDVFGNGMLCSEHIRLVAAFDHRDIFVDPDPDAATSYAERRRLFDLPRSSWRDYDTSLISPGGGVWSRSAKSIPVGAAVREALGLPEGTARMTPAELMRAILLAPVDLLWNGGIGTYVKSRGETHAQAGDKANDAIRVDGHELRVRCVGEGGNLGLTQLGRIEYARDGGPGSAGGRINTDFIDNSAGVDTSDHEVNIKILLDRVVAEGDLTGKQRSTLLASMTDQVAELVLADNEDQNLALANALAQAPALLHVHEDWVRTLEGAGVLDRELEGLPTRRQVARMRERGEGLSAPELAVLLSWTKIVLAEELLDSDLPDDPFLRLELFGYFPAGMRQGYRGSMEHHQLRREIVVTQVVNQLVNNAGITYVHRLRGETGAGAAELARANLVAREIFGAERLRAGIAAVDHDVDAAVQTRMRLEVRTLVERASRWLLEGRRIEEETEALVDRYEVVVEQVMEVLPDLLVGLEREAFETRRDELLAAGVPEPLAVRVAACPAAYVLLGIVETARREEREPVEVARTHFEVGERLGLPWLVTQVLGLPRQDRWQSMARAALRDDLQAVHAQLTAAELRGTPPSGRDVEQAVASLRTITADDEPDLARLSVALRVVRGLL
ncbi:glutamate dehydrogenase [Nocardioides scoriae]|uniref:Glutamate dehydrogenase n=1 Tax=Nocardioides scoriae TaxID=642780 RepID=A0A1H1QSS2_9ACTN|nr:NAD-glutamate dehydrogenase [Nocardioides scoriae]SDS26363.1 glutamate dehydrogenase [Nocardioides scoriae]